jgi:hypothetical protein
MIEPNRQPQAWRRPAPLAGWLGAKLATTVMTIRHTSHCSATKCTSLLPLFNTNTLYTFSGTLLATIPAGPEVGNNCRKKRALAFPLDCTGTFKSPFYLQQHTFSRSTHRSTRQKPLPFALFGFDRIGLLATTFWGTFSA